jgi:nitrogen regulatory protein PII
MKAIFISHNQALTEEVNSILQKLFVRGFTQWTEVKGAGTVSGDPHMGTHTWPSLNNSILTIVDDNKVKDILRELSELNSEVEEQGLRAFVWNIEDTI